VDELLKMKPVKLCRQVARRPLSEEGKREERKRHQEFIKPSTALQDAWRGLGSELKTGTRQYRGKKKRRRKNSRV